MLADLPTLLTTAFKRGTPKGTSGTALGRSLQPVASLSGTLTNALLSCSSCNQGNIQFKAYYSTDCTLRKEEFTEEFSQLSHNISQKFHIISCQNSLFCHSFRICHNLTQPRRFTLFSSKAPSIFWLLGDNRHSLIPPLHKDANAPAWPAQSPAPATNPPPC